MPYMRDATGRRLDSFKVFDAAVAPVIPQPPRPVRGRVRFPLTTSGQMVLPTQRGRVSAVIVNTSATQVLNVGFGAIDSTTAPGSYTAVPVGQEMPVGHAQPVWAYYATSADSALIVTEVTA